MNSLKNDSSEEIKHQKELKGVRSSFSYRRSCEFLETRCEVAH